MLLQKGEKKTTKPGWILLDNQYTEDVFSNPHLVQDIRHVGRHYTTIHCNSRKLRVKKKATLKLYRTVWFDEGTITNILYFSNIREK